jgi:hypothetical protein
MIFFLIRTIIWVTGFVVVTSFLLNYFGYQVNWNYYQERQQSCQEDIKRCKDELVDKGTDNNLDDIKSTCAISCVDPKLFIEKK